MPRRWTRLLFLAREKIEFNQLLKLTHTRFNESSANTTPCTLGWADVHIKRRTTEKKEPSSEVEDTAAGLFFCLVFLYV